MAPNFERNLRQKATYWVPSGLDKFGKRTYTRVGVFPCRWEDLQSLYISKTGEERVSKARVFFATSIELDGYLKLGTDASTSPLGVSGAFEVMAVKTTPDLRAMKTLYAVLL